MINFHAKKTSGRIIPDSYAKQGSKLAVKIDALKSKGDELLSAKNNNDEIRKIVNKISVVMNNLKVEDEFNPLLFKKLIDEITINDRNKLTFKFRVGVTKNISVNGK